MIKKVITIIFLFALVVFAQSDRDPLFDEVEAYLNILKSNSADVICPEDYNNALQHYTEAKTMANEGDSFRDIREELENSIYFITKINDVIDTRSQIFSELLDVRSNALEQDADLYASSDWIKGEKLFAEAAEYADDGEINYARELFPEIKSYYNNAILNAEKANDLLYNWAPLQDANSELANILSPNIYNDGMNYFDDALDNLAEGDDREDLDEYLKEAKISFDQSARNATNFTEKYPSILEKRTEAKEAGAEDYALKFWFDAERNLMNLGEMYEDGDYMDILDERPEAEDLYTLAKHEAAKNKILGPAKNKIDKAYDEDADDLAPITLEKSENLYAEGIMLVDSDDYTEEEVNKVAEESSSYADLAIRITELIKKADDDNPTWEKQILSWNTVPLNLTSSSPVKTTPTYKQTYNTSPEKNADDNLYKYYDDLEDIFNDDEAEISDSDGMIVISLVGLNFLPTQTTLNSDNEILIDKTIAAINLFPNSHITIIGHTDNASTKSFNQNLSEKVAQNVMDYIIDNSNINSTRITAEGHGEDDPIADNKTYEGRMRNRRVDVVIDPM